MDSDSENWRSSNKIKDKQNTFKYNPKEGGTGWAYEGKLRGKEKLMPVLEGTVEGEKKKEKVGNGGWY